MSVWSDFGLHEVIGVMESWVVFLLISTWITVTVMLNLRALDILANKCFPCLQYSSNFSFLWFSWIFLYLTSLLTVASMLRGFDRVSSSALLTLQFLSCSWHSCSKLEWFLTHAPVGCFLSCQKAAALLTSHVRINLPSSDSFWITQRCSRVIHRYFEAWLLSYTACASLGLEPSGNHIIVLGWWHFRYKTVLIHLTTLWIVSGSE